jgi:P4 family phage/plasmid primase-like protien
MMDAVSPDRRVAERLMSLFPCDMRAYAYPRYETAKRRDRDLKLEVTYATIRDPVTVELWQEHRAGKRHLTLGLANEAGLSSVSCVDIDRYTINLLSIVEKIDSQKLPFIIAQSKSGGGHVLAFHDQPIPVADAIAFAEGMARLLGLKEPGRTAKDCGLEYFPKPPSDDPEKLPKGLNMPYFGNEDREINGCKINPGWALKRTGAAMSVEEFLKFAENHRTTADFRAEIMAAKSEQAAASTSAEDGAGYASKKLEAFCAELRAAPSGTRNDLLYGRSKDMGKMIARKWIARDEVEKKILDAIVHWDDQPKCKDTMRNGIEDGKHEPHPDLMPDNYVSSSDHMKRAGKMREQLRPNLLHHRDDFLDFVAGAYTVIDDGVINADTWGFLDKAVTQRGKDGDIGPFLPDRKSVAETIAALKAVTHLAPGISAPCWLDDRTEPPPGDVIAFPNGLLDLRDNKFYPSDPAFFAMGALGFAYVPEAAEPARWKQFLREIFADDEQEIATVQEIIGYLLAADVSQQKAFLLLGPKRSGKGTILGMLRHLLAGTAVVGPSLRSLGTNFGLAPLIGKRLAIVDDLRIGSPKDTEVLVENLLKITGGGFFTIDRKFKSAWNGTLPIKLILVSNIMPRLGDDSAALANRFIISTTRVSFFDREDPVLFEKKLLPELVGVFHWALEGLRRLRDRGRFAETESSKQTKERLAFLGSPVMGFVADRCELGPDKSISKDELYQEWSLYAEANGLFRLGKDHFYEALYAATGDKVHGGKKRDGGVRVPTCFGITVRSII